MKNETHIVVVGCGAIGGTLAAFLTKNGCNVTILCKNGELASEISSGKGLHISGIRGDFYISINAVSDIHQIDRKADYVFMAVKATDLEKSTRDILPVLKENTLVVSLQNGICEDLLAAVVGKERTVGCTVGYGATMHSQGHLQMTSEGEFVIGYPDRAADAKLLELKNVMELFIPTRISHELMSDRYSKLIINSCITTLGAISGQTLGSMLSRKNARKIFIKVISEAMNVADAINLHVIPYAGKFNYYNFRHWPDFKKHLFLMGFGFKYRRLTSSSLQSLQRGRPTEIDFLNGYIVKKGESAGIDVSVNAALVKMIHQIERGERSIGQKNLGEIS